MKTEAVLFSAFPALLLNVITIQIPGYGEDQAYVESKHMFIAVADLEF